MPKREDEYWAGMTEPRGRGLCPFCGSSNISYNERFRSWRCNKCEHSFPIPSYGPGGGFGKEARWFGKTTEEERRAEFAEAARKARAAKGKESGRSESGYPFDPDHVGYYRGEHSSKRSKGRGPRRKRGVSGCLIFLIVVFSIGMLTFGLYNLYKTNHSETIDSSTSESVEESNESEIYDSTTNGSDEVEINTGEYGNYFLGLVSDSGVILGGNGCYDDSGEFIVLINNKSAKDPTYDELLHFLKNDTTDSYVYQSVVLVSGFYYGDAEDLVNIDRIYDIIDGIVQPSPPKVCADFAERLHNEAEMAGIRCAYVSVELTEGGHALNAFQTTDKGLIYIDCTGSVGEGPINYDRIVDLMVGSEYNPSFLFYSGGWYVPSGEMGIVNSFSIIWDGEWKD